MRDHSIYDCDMEYKCDSVKRNTSTIIPPDTLGYRNLFNLRIVS